MVKISCKSGLAMLLILLLALPLLVACGNGDKSPNATENTQNVETVENVVITIGNLTDITGVSANSAANINMALDDMVGYYNDQGLVPGVELKVIKYDGQYDPAKDIPGYEWLRERGADLIFTPVGSTAVTLKERVVSDQVPIFTVAVNEDAFSPPGYVFAPGICMARHASYTLLEWIAENDPDFPEDSPAKIGGAFWNESVELAILGGAEEYAKAHPDEYEWEGGHLTNFSFMWGPEVEALKDCDYVLPPIPPTNFVKEYRQAGYTAKFIGTDASLAFLGLVDSAGLWPEIDGMIAATHSGWWTDQGEIIDLAKTLLQKNHPDNAEDIMGMGISYLSVNSVYVVLELIKATVEAVGPEAFTSQALYDTALSFSMTVDGTQHSFSQIKRASADHIGIYEVRAAEENVFRVDAEWIPVVRSP